MHHEILKENCIYKCIYTWVFSLKIYSLLLISSGGAVENNSSSFKVHISLSFDTPYPYLFFNALSISIFCLIILITKEFPHFLLHIKKSIPFLELIFIIKL